MGINRDKKVQRSEKRTHSVASAAASTSQSAPAKRSQPPWRLRLRNRVPKAGMIYPIRDLLMKRTRHEVDVKRAIWQAIGEIYPTTRAIDNVLAGLFEEATKVLQADAAGIFKNTPIRLIASLTNRPALLHWVKALSIHRLVSLFLILRAARLNWFDTPREPYMTEQHCRVARAIDDFRAADTMNWSAQGVADWLIYTNLDPAVRDIVLPMHLDDVEPDNEGGDNNDDDDDDDGLFVKQAAPAPAPEIAEDAMEIEIDSDAGLTETTVQLLYARVKASMQTYHIDIEEDAIIQTLANLKLESVPVPTRKRNGNPFIDDDSDDDGDEEMTVA